MQLKYSVIQYALEQLSLYQRHPVTHDMVAAAAVVSYRLEFIFLAD